MKLWPLTPRGTGAVLLGLLCFVLAHEFKITELIYISILLLTLVAAGLATLYLVRRTERVSRSFAPDVAAVGRELDVRLQVEIRSPLPAPQGGWVDRLPSGLTGAGAGVFPATGSGMIGGRTGVELEYRVRADRRGIRSVGPLLLTSTDPFGLARRTHTIGTPVPLTIAPAIVELSALTDLPGEAGGSMHTTTHRLGQGADNLIPRHYVSGDSMRRIHWRASAHRDELMVRQEEQETTPEATVLLDRSVRRWDAGAAQAPGADPGFEAGVTACISAVARLVHEGYLVSVRGVNGAELGDPVDNRDATGIERLAIALAPLTSRGGAPLDGVVRLFAGTMTGPLIVVTGALDETDAASLAPLTHHSTLPVLLAVAPRGRALERAAEAGWRVAAIGPDADLARAWGSAVDRGVSRVGG